MAGEWKNVMLGDVITLQRGFDLPSQDRKPGKVPIISSSGVSGYHVEAGAVGPGVVIGRYGTIGQVFFIRGDYWPLNTTLWVKDFHGTDPRFASYLLRTIDFRACSDKSSVPGVNRNDLHQIPILRPPLSEQKAIAHILGTLDDKIELNRRMNATLEAMARALFQSWFVDFDPVRAKLDGRKPAGLDAATAALFPAHFQESPLGHIPQGWRVVSLNAISNVSSGRRPTGQNNSLTPECNIPLYGGGGCMGYVSAPLYEKPILFTGRVGTLGLIFRATGRSWPSDNTLIIEPTESHFDFIYFALHCKGSILLP
ncbi:MAG: restriction endonuclease subunit S [Nitrosospira sp.]|nr:restriction endonuclease subunit S [Nitrosospira sp.]